MARNTSRPGSWYFGRKQSFLTSIIVTALIVGYVFLRPAIERKVGVQLPMLPDAEPAQHEQATDGDRAEDRQSSEADKGSARPSSASNGNGSAGVLRDVGGKVKMSPAGLRYGPGSFEGHRIKHVLRHAVDDPGRPIHGVFDGEEDAIFLIIDEAYLIAKQGDPRVDVEREGARQILTVDLGRRIGYVGGQSGRRSNHPPATGLRLVLEEVDVITAFPVRQ